VGVNPPKGQEIFLRPIRKLGLDIGEHCAVVLVVEENRKEATNMAKRRANGEGSIWCGIKKVDSLFSRIS